MLHVVYVSHPFGAEVANPTGLLHTWLNRPGFKAVSPALKSVLALVIIVLSAFYANALLNNKRMFNKVNMLAGISLLLVTALFVNSNRFSAALILLPGFIYMYQQLCGLYNSPRPRAGLFNVGLTFGAGLLLYHPVLWLFPAVFAGVAFMRSFRIAEWCILFLGMITPWYFWLSYEFLSGGWNPAAHIPYNLFSVKQFTLTGYFWLSAVLVTLLVLLGIAGWQQSLRRMLIQGRKNWALLLVMGVCTLPMIFIKSGNPMEAFALLAFPVAALSALAFQYTQKNIAGKLLFWVLLLAAAAVSWHYGYGS